MVFNIMGWIGMILVLVAYGLLSMKKIDTGKVYQILNLFAAIFMAIGIFPTKAWFSFILQVIWGIIALHSLVKLLKNKKEG